jgi:hypothetical protein
VLEQESCRPLPPREARVQRVPPREARAAGMQRVPPGPGEERVERVPPRLGAVGVGVDAGRPPP